MFWDRFYQLCIKHDTKPNPVAKSLGISSGVLTKWKSGGIPNGETLTKIADYFGVAVDYLLGRTDNPHSGAKKQDAGDLQFSAKECKVIRAYRDQPEMQPAVDKLLNIYEDTNSVKVYRAAKSEESHPDEIISISRERLQKLKDAPETDDIL